MFSEATLKIGLVLCFCAMVDYGYRRYCFELSLRMTPEDVRAEVQAIEPNPWITSERKQRYQQWRNEAVGEDELDS